MDRIRAGFPVKSRGTVVAGFSQYALRIRAELNLHSGDGCPIFIGHKDEISSFIFFGGSLRKGGPGTAGGCLLVERFERPGCDGTLPVVDDHTIPVQDDRLRQGRGTVYDVPYIVILRVQSKGDAITLISKIDLRIVCHDRGVDSQHGNIIPVLTVEGIKVGQLLQAGSAVGGPEVDEGHFAPRLREGKS